MKETLRKICLECLERHVPMTESYLSNLQPSQILRRVAVKGLLKEMRTKHLELSNNQIPSKNLFCEACEHQLEMLVLNQKHD